MYAKELTPKFADEKSMRLKRGLKKFSAAQKKVENRNLAKNGMLKPLRVSPVFLCPHTLRN
jgi:hypothetical protein